MKAKICGITTNEAAQQAIKHNVWALGFNFITSSPRFIQDEKARNIIDTIPSSIIKIGLFPSLPYIDIIRKMADLHLDYAQLYEDIECPRYYKKKMILSLTPHSFDDVPPSNVLQDYAFILIDAPYQQGHLRGGTGRLSNWSVAKSLSSRYQVILAGGLHLNNVVNAIETVRPYAVDCASGVEHSLNVKNPELIKLFLGAVNNAE